MAYLKLMKSSFTVEVKGPVIRIKMPHILGHRCEKSKLLSGFVIFGF